MASNGRSSNPSSKRSKAWTYQERGRRHPYLQVVCNPLGRPVCSVWRWKTVHHIYYSETTYLNLYVKSHREWWGVGEFVAWRGYCGAYFPGGDSGIYRVPGGRNSCLWE